MAVHAIANMRAWRVVILVSASDADAAPVAYRREHGVGERSEHQEEHDPAHDPQRAEEGGPRHLASGQRWRRATLAADAKLDNPVLRACCALARPPRYPA